MNAILDFFYCFCYKTTVSANVTLKTHEDWTEKKGECMRKEKITFIENPLYPRPYGKTFSHFIFLTTTLPAFFINEN